jgi:hypothetical protein
MTGTESIPFLRVVERTDKAQKIGSRTVCGVVEAHVHKLTRDVIMVNMPFGLANEECGVKILQIFALPTLPLLPV